MPTATIRAPLEGDTVSAAGVSISSGYDGFNNNDLTCTIAGMADNPAQLNGSGTHLGSMINNVPTGMQSVVVFSVAGNPLDHQNNVNVTSGPTPVPMDPPEMRLYEGKNKNLKTIPVNGKKIPDGSTAAYVVVQVIEVNAVAGTRNVVAAGAVSVDENRKWNIVLKADVAAGAHIQYSARAFAYNKNQLLLGSETISIKKG